jgi:hypothetical protein
MQPQRETMTDSLADIIQLLHLGFKNGILTVERGAGTSVEEGYIVFNNGRVVEARVGHYTGLTAFNYLNSWRTCRFSFTNNATVLPQPSQTSPLSLRSDSAPLVNTFTNNGMPPAAQNGGSGQFYTRPVSSPTFPVRLDAGEITLQHPETMSLQRSHRRLLLLINGQRNINELARLMARTIEEVQALLDELEHAGLIRQ